MAVVEVPEETLLRPKGLAALAMSAGNSVRASELCGVPQSTLRRWRVEFAEEYERVRRELAPQLEAVVLSEMQSFLVEAARVKRLALEATALAIENGEITGKDLPNALSKVAVAEGIAVDKVLALTGRPTSVVEHRSAGELVARLARLGAVIDGSATELPAGDSAT